MVAPFQAGPPAQAGIRKVVLPSSRILRHRRSVNDAPGSFWCAADRRPIEDACPCYTCRNYSRGAIRHLFQAGEMLGPTLTTLHNLHFFASFLSAIRDAIAAGTLEASARQWLERMYAEDEAGDD